MDIMEFIGWICFFYLGWQLLKSWIFVQDLKQRIAEAVDEDLAVQAAAQHVLALKFEHVEENGHQVVLAYGKNNKFFPGFIKNFHQLKHGFVYQFFK